MRAEVMKNWIIDRIKGSRGMTLVEVMIAMSVMLMVFLALMQTAMVAIESNMVNVLREEGLSVAEETMIAARNTPFADLVSSADTAQRNLRGVTDFPFAITTTVTDLTANSKQVVVDVTWSWKDEDYSHKFSTIRRSSE